jgi:hypothetical protein
VTHHPNPYDWENRVRQLETEGLTRSDAQGVVDAQDQRHAPAKFDVLDVVADIFSMPRMKPRDPKPERRDSSAAGQLRRAAWNHERDGRTATAILLNNAAYILDHPEESVKCFPRETP